MTIFPVFKVLTSYLIKHYFVRVCLVSTMLVAILQLLDVMAKTDDILAVQGNTTNDVWHYVSLRAPQILDRFLPFAAMLASMLALTELSQHGEIVAMRASGLGAPRIMLPIIAIGALIALFHFTFRELVAIPAAARLAVWESIDFKRVVPMGEDVRENVWRATEDGYLKIQAASRTRDEIDFRGMTLYALDGQDNITVQRLARATYKAGQWSTNTNEAALVESQSAPVGRGILEILELHAEGIFQSQPIPDQLTIGQLHKAHQNAVRRNEPVNDLDTALFHRFSAPAASMILPILGAIVGFGPPRRGAILVRLVLGIAIGFSYFVTDNLMTSLGKLDALPAALAAFVPMLLALLGGAYTILKVELPS